MKKIFDFLSSSKLGIVLFFLIASISIIGTILPPEYSIDFYHSWFFIALLFLFLINLVACSVKRFPVSWKQYKKDLSKIDPVNLAIKEVIKIKNKEKLEKKLLSLGFKKIERDGREVFVKDKYRFSYLSVYFVHFSLVIVLIGAIIGGIFGFSGRLIIGEGGVSNQIITSKGGIIFLPFTVKLNKFEIQLYPDGKTPKEYISEVTILDNGTKLDEVIKVNHPLKYKGYTFYQASWDIMPTLLVEINSETIKGVYKIAPNLPAFINNKYIIKLEGYRMHENFFACKILFINTEKNETKSEIFLLGIPKKFEFAGEVFSVHVKDVKEKYISIFEVKKDPGVWIVFLGFFLMVLGVILVYFFEPKTFLASFKEDRLVIGALSKRDKESLKHELNKLVKTLEKDV